MIVSELSNGQAAITGSDTVIEGTKISLDFDRKYSNNYKNNLKRIFVCV